MSADLAVIVPVLNRPHRAQPTLEGFQRTAPGCRVLFVADPDDKAELRALKGSGAEYITPGGNYASKINRGVRLTEEPLLFLGADDLTPQSGWFETALRKMRHRIGVVGVNDLCSQRVLAGIHATHFLMTREYALQPTIDGSEGPLCTLYDHSFTDDELVATARKRKALAFAPRAIVAHQHPDNGGAKWDDTYRKGRARFREDKRLFRERSPLWA